VLRYLSSGRTDQWRAPVLIASGHVRSSPARGTAAETAPTGSALRVTRRCISVLLTYLFIIWVEALWTRETRGRCRLSETACAPTDGPRKRRTPDRKHSLLRPYRGLRVALSPTRCDTDGSKMRDGREKKFDRWFGEGQQKCCYRCCPLSRGSPFTRRLYNSVSNLVITVFSG
jgi:hypothetical protein